MSPPRGWIGVDLDGTLAHYEKWVHAGHVGAPVSKMVARVKGWLEDGWEVRVFTARIYPINDVIHPGDILRFQPADDREREAVTALRAVQDWCLAHVGRVLPVTNVKDYGMVELWDDRCVQVQPNKGEPVGASTRGLK